MRLALADRESLLALVVSVDIHIQAADEIVKMTYTPSKQRTFIRNVEVDDSVQVEVAPLKNLVDHKAGKGVQFWLKHNG